MTKSSGTILDGECRPEGARCTHRAGGQEPALDKHAEQDSAACLGTGTVPRNQLVGRLYVLDASGGVAYAEITSTEK
jgi:hypothetical protein